MGPDNVALELYTLREQTKEDFPGALRAVAEAGYKAVEVAGYGKHTPQELRSLLDELGIEAISAHVPYQRFEQEFDKVIEELHTLGCEYAVVPYTSEELRNSPEAVKRLAETFNRWGERCATEGLRFGYHNHAFEFEPLGEETMYDLLAAQTDPAFVDLQIDVYWVMYAGLDPIELIRRHSGRVPTLHAKEMSNKPDRSDTTVGDGITPWPQLIAAANASGTQWLIVEQEDDPANTYRDIKRSFENLRNLISMTLGS